jgi:excisionase family DNA binding protein
MTTGQPERLFSAREAACVLRCSEWWLKEQARRRRIPFLMLGGSYRFTASHLSEILAASEVRPVSSHLVDTAPQVAARSRRASVVGTHPSPLRPRPPRRAQRTAEPPPAA